MSPITPPAQTYLVLPKPLLFPTGLYGDISVFFFCAALCSPVAAFSASLRMTCYTHKIILTKSNPDRITCLPESASATLMLRLAKIKAQHTIDLAPGRGEIELPFALECKSPSAPFK